MIEQYCSREKLDASHSKGLNIINNSGRYFSYKLFGIGNIGYKVIFFVILLLLLLLLLLLFQSASEKLML